MEFQGMLTQWQLNKCYNQIVYNFYIIIAKFKINIQQKMIKQYIFTNNLNKMKVYYLNQMMKLYQNKITI